LKKQGRFPKENLEEEIEEIQDENIRKTVTGLVKKEPMERRFC